MPPERTDTPLRTPAHHLSLHTPQPYPNSQTDAIIYGTNILLGKVSQAIQKFILQFQEARTIDGELVSQQVYRSRLNQLATCQDHTLFEVEGRHVREFDRELYLQLVYYPAEMISCFDTVIKELYERYFIEPQTDFQTRSFHQSRQGTLLMGLKGLHQDQRISVKGLGPPQIGRLVMVQAIVIRVSEVFPQMKSAYFRCQSCGDQLSIHMVNARVQEPESCRVCMKKQTMQIIHNHCSFTDKQYLKLQELPELVTQGQTPSSLTAIAYDSNVDGFRPGDRVELIGIYRTQTAKVDRFKGTLRTLFNTYLDVISCSVLDQNRYGLNKVNNFTDQERRKFLTFSQNPEVIDNLVKSFSPSIFGHQIIKKGILTQLFGGTKKTFQGRGSIRADVNICLIGDPSTAKSQLLQQVHRIAPRSIYTSGRGSSAVGLTANVRKDIETREFVLESGALVLADQGICCIDEFDKMDQNSRTILLEAMQQQTISIAKAGIVCQLNSRTAILAAANPIGSKYDLKKSVIENINLPPSLISRFDLLYILLDIANQAADTRIATHILDFYIHGHSAIPRNGPLSLPELNRYISFARQYIRPILTESAGQKLQNEYNSMRAKGQSNKTITATPRQLESLIRMSQAFAKMRLSSSVSEKDVDEAVQLMEKATLSSATDPESGLIDLDIITTGRSSALKKKVHEVAHKIRQFLFANQSKYRKQTVFDRFCNQFNSFETHKKLGANREQIFQALKLLETDELISIYGQNKLNPHFKLMHHSDD